MPKMHDLGALAVRWSAPVIARYYRSGDEQLAEVQAEVRGYGTDRPRTAADLVQANNTRVVSWLALLSVPLAVFIAASAARGAVTPKVVTGLETVMKVAATLGMFCAGMLAVSAGHASLSQFFEGDLRRRLEVTRRNPEPRPGLLGRLCMPSLFDVVPALVFVACFAPLLFP